MFTTIIQSIKRPFIWICRFRNRCGYGVHSPFAFNFITQIVYEKTPYYKYKQLTKEVKEQINKHPKGWNDASVKVNRLLFRMVNHLQPNVIVSIGQPSSTSLYLQAAKQDTTLHSYLPQQLDKITTNTKIDFLYIHCNKNSQDIQKLFDTVINQIPPTGVCVIKGIHYSSTMKQSWKKMIADPRCGITFDLYDVGIIFFDIQKIKQHYRVNF